MERGDPVFSPAGIRNDAQGRLLRARVPPFRFRRVESLSSHRLSPVDFRTPGSSGGGNSLPREKPQDQYGPVSGGSLLARVDREYRRDSPIRSSSCQARHVPRVVSKGAGTGDPVPGTRMRGGRKDRIFHDDRQDRDGRRAVAHVRDVPGGPSREKLRRGGVKDPHTAGTQRLVMYIM